jgi:Alr-MurF fusion protein
VQNTLFDIQTTLQARWLQRRRPEALVERLLLDSRQTGAPVGTLFFALPGKRHDGHHYIQDLYNAGVRHFVVSREIPKENLPDADILLVDNTLDALQQLAAHRRSQFEIPVVGITGSNGKTVVKEWLYQLLAPDFNIVRSPKSYNSQTGVPLSVWQMQAQHTLALFEAGISRPGEMRRLEKIIQPTIGIFTNIGPAHREGFASKKDKVWEKMELFKNVDLLVYCRDHTTIDEAVEGGGEKVEKGGFPPLKDAKKIFCWSKEGKKADLQITDIQTNNGQTHITGVFHSEPPPALHLQPSNRNPPASTTLTIPFTDDAAIENAIHCWAFMYCLGAPQAQTAERMSQLEPVAMRLELKAGINRCTLINDAYNNDHSSLRIALQFARQQTRSGALTLILSDILQSGQAAAEVYRKVAGTVAENGVRRIIGIGSEIPALANFLPADFDLHFFPTTEVFLDHFPNLGFQDETILLKGARPFEFERIAARLEQKAHKTQLEVNLSALIHNLNVYSRLLQPGVRMMAMVKAAAYGSGPAEVAKLLEFHKVDYLGVAYADEGIELRKAGIRLPILVLNPEPAGFDALLRYQLEPEVYSIRLLDDLIRFAGQDQSLNIHLKLDTGMHRLGFEREDLSSVLEKLASNARLRVKTVFTHLAASDTPGHDAFTRHQAAVFSALYEALAAGLGYRPLRHIVNTGGIARFPEYHFEMVRLGIGLYGIDSSGLQDQLRVVNTLKATVSQIKNIEAGETVGYNRNGPVDRPLRIATISLGYADGLHRSAGNGRYSVLLRGKPAPTIGNVCMDMTMIDLSGIPDAREGDEVIVFGEHKSVQELAICMQTIPYEVFTGISERVKRVYVQE